MRRVGSLKERRVNVRLLAATNRDLAARSGGGALPRGPVLPHQRDVAGTAAAARAHWGTSRCWSSTFSAPNGRSSPRRCGGSKRYPWPGNVRQLINAIERAKIMADDHLVRLRDLPREVAHGRSCQPRCGPAANSAADIRDGGSEDLQAAKSSGTRVDDLWSIERAKVVEVLRRERGNKTRAARALGIDRRKLYRLIDRYAVKTLEWIDDY